MDWSDEYENVEPLIVKIETPDGFGTGLFYKHVIGPIWSILTAYHVVEKADSWGQPIRIYHPSGNRYLDPLNRRIFSIGDNGIIALAWKESSMFERKLIPLLSPKEIIRIHCCPR